MIIRFSKDLKKQEIYAHGAELASVMGMDRDEHGKRIYTHPKEKEHFVAGLLDPVLVTDMHKISQLDPTKRDTVFKLYESVERITEYDEVSLTFNQNKYLNTWGPSIDTLLFCKALNKIDFSNIRGAIEVGAGSGFITKYILSQTKAIKNIELIDLNPHAIACCRDNIKDERASFIVGDAVEYMKENKYDLIVCNPPYIPRPQGIDDNAYEGTGLLEYLIENIEKLLTKNGFFITNFSSLSEEKMRSVAEKAGVKIEILEQAEVPLKVMNVLNNKDWIKYLIDSGFIKAEHKSGYDFWHQINIVKLTKNN